MIFIRKKNLLGGEDLLYTPQLHWIYTIKPIVGFLPFVILMLILWRITNSFFEPLELPGIEFVRMIFQHAFLSVILIVVLIIAWRILQYANTEFGITNKRLIIKKGVFRIFVAEISFDRIESIYCTKGILGRIFNYGTICLSGVGGMMPVFYMVCKPYAVRRKILSIIEKNKLITVINGDLPKPKIIVKPEPVVEEEPIYRYGTFVRMVSDN
jgi:membrane protein YdbS with pleckstrin-like domain